MNLTNVKVSRNMSVKKLDGDKNIIWGPKQFTLIVDFEGVDVDVALEDCMRQLVIKQAGVIRSLQEAQVDKLPKTISLPFSEVGKKAPKAPLTVAELSAKAVEQASKATTPEELAEVEKLMAAVQASILAKKEELE